MSHQAVAQRELGEGRIAPEWYTKGRDADVKLEFLLLGVKVAFKGYTRGLGPLFRRSTIPRVRYSAGPLFRRHRRKGP